MVKVANLSADLTANTTSFDQSLSRARRQLQTSGRSMSRSAESFNSKISKSFRRASQNVAAFQGPLGGVAGRLSGLASIASSTGVALGAALLALSGFTLGIVKAVKVSDEYEGNLNRINAVLKATGGASAQSADDLREFSRDLASASLASVQGVEAAAAKLLTFRRISGDTFKRTLVLAQDLAATGFGSLSDNVTQLGKALEDPIRNLGALTRNGVSFTQAQQDVIKSLVETGQAAEAQGLILDALAQQVGGAGAAEGGDLAKGLDLLSQRLDEFFLALDKATGAGDVFNTFLNRFTNGIEKLTTTLDPGDIPLIDQLSEATEQLTQMLAGAAEEVEFLKGRFETAEGAEAAVQTAIDQQRLLIEGIRARIAGEEDKAAAIQATGRAQQEAIQAEFEAGQIEKARIAEQKIFIKEVDRQNEAIKKTIDSLQVEVNGLQAEQAALEASTTTIEEAAIAREILAEQQKLNVTELGAEAETIEFLIRQREKLSAAIKAEKDIRKRAADVVEQNKTELEKLNEELAEFNELRNQGLLTEQEHQRAVERTTEKINDLDGANKELEKTVENVADISRDAFEDFVLGAKNAGEAVKQLGLELARLVLREATGDLFAGVAKSLVGGVASSLFGGFFADGGRPPLGKASIVGESGPELFIPDSAGTVIPNGDLQGAGNGLTVFADMRGASVEAVARLETFVAELNGSIEPRAVNAVVSEKSRNPGLFGAV